MKNVILLALALFPAFAFAGVKEDVAKIEATTRACLENPDNQSTVGMKECLFQGYQAADKLLNKFYKETVAGLSKKTGDELTDKDNAETLRRLRDSQRAWVNFRDANSNLYGISMLGGTGEGLMIGETAYDMTKARVLELNTILNRN